MFVKHDIDDVINKVGGKFKTTVLVQKRLKGLAAGASQTISNKDRAGFTVFEVVFEELMRENIKLNFADTRTNDDGKSSE